LYTLKFSHFQQIENNEHVLQAQEYKYTLSARGSQSIIDYSITNGKAAKIIQDIRVHRGMELHTDHYLLCAKVKFPPRWLKGAKEYYQNQKNFVK
jgi:hypothetical protein